MGGDSLVENLDGAHFLKRIRAAKHGRGLGWPTGVAWVSDGVMGWDEVASKQISCLRHGESVWVVELPLIPPLTVWRRLELQDVPEIPRRQHLL